MGMTDGSAYFEMAGLKQEMLDFLTGVELMAAEPPYSDEYHKQIETALRRSTYGINRPPSIAAGVGLDLLIDHYGVTREDACMQLAAGCESRALGPGDIYCHSAAALFREVLRQPSHGQHPNIAPNAIMGSWAVAMLEILRALKVAWGLDSAATLESFRLKLEVSVEIFARPADPE